MHRSEGEDRVRCLQCGAEVSTGRDRSYTVSEDEALCMKCALERGGRYDELRDDWSEPPRLDGLPLAERSHSHGWR